MKRLNFMFAASLLLEGCASTQLNYNTVNLGQNYDDLLTRQVSYNLQKFIDNPVALPSQIKIGGGTAQTANSVSPSFTLPFTSQIVSGVTSAVTGIGTSRGRTASGFGMSLAASDQWNQSWSLDPVSDPDQLRRLRALYQYATRNIDYVKFECTYPIIEAGGPKAATPVYDRSIKYVRLAKCVDFKGNPIQPSYEPVEPDRTFIRQPGCIMCDYGETVTAGPYRGYRILEKNKGLTQQWLYRPTDQVLPAPQEPVPLPSNGDTNLLVLGTAGLATFYEFVIFVQEASVQGVGSPSSNGQSYGRKTEPTFRVTGPAGSTTSIIP